MKTKDEAPKPSTSNSNRQVGMEKIMHVEEPSHDSNPDWALPSTSTYPLPTSRIPVPLFRQSPSYTPACFLPVPTTSEQRIVFNAEPLIESENFNFSDVVRFGGPSPTPAEMLQIDEDREAAINLTLQMQMEVDFQAYVQPAEQVDQEMDQVKETSDEDVPAAQAEQSVENIPEHVNLDNKEISVEEIPLPTQQQDDIIVVDTVDKQENQSSVKDEGFKISKAHLRKSKKAQKKLLKKKH